MTKKIDEMLRSMDPEMRLLGLEACKVENPMLWAALMGFIGPRMSSSDMYHALGDAKIFIGARVKYKGMENCPTMVVTAVTAQQLASVVSDIMDPDKRNPGFCLNLTAKYYNKSTQTFCISTDRIECFEIINEKREI